MSTDMTIIRESMKLKARLRLSRVQQQPDRKLNYPYTKERMVAVCTMRALCDHANVYLLGSERDPDGTIVACEYRCDDCNMQMTTEVAF